MAENAFEQLQGQVIGSLTKIEVRYTTASVSKGQETQLNEPPTQDMDRKVQTRDIQETQTTQDNGQTDPITGDKGKSVDTEAAPHAPTQSDTAQNDTSHSTHTPIEEGNRADDNSSEIKDEQSRNTVNSSLKCDVTKDKVLQANARNGMQETIEKHKVYT